MRYKVIYENNRGQRVNLSERPYFLNIEPILDYQWSYSEKEKRRGNIIAGFAKDIQSVDLTLHIMDANAEARDEAVDYFNNVIEADIYDGIAGRLIIGDWYTWGYIIASKNAKWQYGKPVVKKTIKLVREQENWYHVVQKANYGSEQAEELYNFVEEDIKTYEGADTNSLKSLTATINPKQDLHGYDKPWIGGAGKNKLEIASASFWTTRGVATRYANNGIRFYGTVTDAGYIGNVQDLSITLKANTTYTFSISESTTYRLDFLAGWSSKKRIDAGNTSVTYTPTEDTTITRICSYSSEAGASVDVTFKDIQIEEGSTATSYAPYSNICPISGWDEVGVSVVGKNFLEVTATSQTINGVTFTVNDDGTINANGTATASTTLTARELNFDDLVSGTAYKINGSPSISNAWILVQYFLDSTYVSEFISVNGADTSFTPIDDGTYNRILIRIRIQNGAVINNVEFKPMIRLASVTDATYEPYTGNRYTTNLPETVYGGSLDVVNGVLTVDRAMVDLGTLDWTYDSQNNRFYTTGISELVKRPSDNFEVANSICSAYSVTSLNQFWNSADGKYAISITGAVSIRDSRYTDATSFKTAMNGVQLCYELAEPRTIQLTPKQVTTLLGTNNVWADSGDVTVEYWDDAGRIKTASGSVATFSKYNSMSGAGYDYPYDYMADAQSQKRIENPNSVPCDFSITIQGYVDRPEVQIGDNVIAFDLEVPYGAFLTVDSSKKTAIMTLANGEQVNVFGARDPDYYLFERIKEGKNTVTWNGSFLWEIRMLEERSEPRWHMD